MENKSPSEGSTTGTHSQLFMYVEYPLLHWTIKLLLLKQNQFISFFILFRFIPRLVGKQKLNRILTKIPVLFLLLSLMSIFSNLYEKKSSKHEL